MIALKVHFAIIAHFALKVNFALIVHFVLKVLLHHIQNSIFCDCVCLQGYPLWGVGGHKKSEFLGLINSQVNPIPFFHWPGRVRQWQRTTFIFFFFLLLQGTSIGLARTNHALLSLVKTKLTAVNMHVYQPLTKLCCVHLSLCS